MKFFCNTMFDQFDFVSGQAYAKYADGKWVFQVQRVQFVANHESHSRYLRDGKSLAMDGSDCNPDANIGITNQLLEGIDDFLESVDGASLALVDLFDYLAVTGYFANTLLGNVHQAVASQWMAASNKRWLAGLEPTKYSYYDRMINNSDIAHCPLGSIATTGIGPMLTSQVSHPSVDTA